VIEAKRGNIAKTEAIKILLGTSVTSVPPSAISPKGKSGKPLQTLEAGGFIFQMMSSKLSNKTIKFSFLITNKGKDKSFGMSGTDRSRLFDYEGNEYEAGKAQVGSSSRSNDWVYKTLISRIPIKASISFGGIPPEINGISVLEINCDKFIVQFRNVPLSR
jgi:hypothetical protein